MFEQLIGQKLGRYHIKSLIGEGGMGSVLRGFDETLQRDVAIKILAPQFTRQPNFRERFLQEARTAARLRHPGIVQVYDFGQAPSLLYIVMEYIEGDDLHQLLQRLNRNDQRIILTEAIALLQEVARSVDYAHRHGVLHRDIKPANIMLRDEPSARLPYQPILTDLGLAKLASGGVITQVGTSMGTPTYMSPEQAMGESVDSRSDVYSLGIMMYELAVGRPPFKVRSLTEAIRYHTKTPPPPPSEFREDIPENLEAVILKALNKDPADRYEDAQSLAAALDQVLKELDQTADKPEPVPAGVSLFTLYQPAAEQEGEGSVGISAAGDGYSYKKVPDQLIVLASDQTSRVVKIKSESFVIGRDPASDLVLDERKVSRRHVRIDFDGTHYTITDLNSTNGSFLNDLRLLPDVPERWTEGGVLRVGDAWIRLEKGHDRPKQDPFALGSRRAETGVMESSPGMGFVGIFIEDNQLSASPGERLSFPVTLFNQGRLVDRFECSVTGIPAEWVVSLPEPVHLMPGEKKEVEIAIHPPRSHQSRAGQHLITIKVASQVDTSQVAELKLNLDLAPFNQFSMELRPRRQTDIRSAQYQVIVENSGNNSLAVNMEALGHEASLMLTFDRQLLQIPPGETVSNKLTVTSTVPLAGDQMRRHYFTVLARPSHAPELAQQTQGEWEQGVPTFEVALDPEKQEGAFEGNYDIRLSNRGGDDIQIQLEVKDASKDCSFSLDPDALAVPAGREALARLKVTPNAPLISETPRSHRFSILARPEEAPTSVRQADGEWIQYPPSYSAELTPQSQGGLAGASYTVRLTNQSEDNLTIQLEAADRENACRFTFEPQQVSVPSSGRADAAMQVSPKQALEGDSPKIHQFVVSVFPTEAPASKQQLQGEYRQLPPLFEIRLVPEKFEGRNRGIAQVTVSNKSDSQLNVKLEGAESNNICLFEFEPSVLRVPIGADRASTMTVRAKTRLKGKEAVTHDLTVTGSAQEAPATIRIGQAQWIHLPGGRPLALTLLLFVFALAVAVIGWALSWGLMFGLYESEMYFRPVEQLANTGLGWSASQAVVASIYGLLGGILGGFLTALAARLAEPTLKGIHLILIALGWAVAFSAAAALVFLNR